MKFTLYKDWTELPKSSDTLFLTAEKTSIFLSREWFEALTPHLVNQHQSLLLLCVIEKDTVLAILPILTNTNREWTSFTHPYSALFSIVLVEENQTKILSCLCEGLKTLDFDYLTLAPIDSDNSTLNKFQNAMETAGLNVYRNHKEYNWFHHIKGESYAEYMAKRPAKVRNTVQRKQRKLAREYDDKIQLYVDKNLDQALAIYHDLYTVSWKANEQYEALVKEATQQFAKRNWPRLALLRVDNTPIAAQLWFVAEGKASIFRLVYDQAWKDYSPGSILMNALLKHVIDNDKVTEIDFLSGNDKYKQDWMSERRERSALVCVKKTKQMKKTDNLLTKAIRFIKMS